MNKYQKERAKRMKKKQLPSKISDWKFKHYWYYVWHGDSWHSFLVFFLLAFFCVKFVFFPFIGVILGTDYPIVAIVTGSMEHKLTDNFSICDSENVGLEDKNLDVSEFWKYCGKYYEDNFDITEEEFEEFDYSGGLNVGDVLILKEAKIENIEVGDVIVFVPQDKVKGVSRFFSKYGPVVHRVIKLHKKEDGVYFQTKGDHNPVSGKNFEEFIPPEDVLGVPPYGKSPTCRIS